MLEKSCQNAPPATGKPKARTTIARNFIHVYQRHDGLGAGFHARSRILAPYSHIGNSGFFRLKNAVGSRFARYAEGERRNKFV